MIRKWKGSTPQAARPRQVDWWTCMQENAYFHAEEDEEVYCWPPEESAKRYHARGGRVKNPWWKLKKQLYGRRKAAKNVQ